MLHIYLLTIFALLVSIIDNQLNVVPDDCFTSSTDIQQLNGCFEQFFATNNSITLTEWESALPNNQEIVDYQQLIIRLMNANNTQSECNDQLLDSFVNIKPYIKLRRFLTNYCVIYERQTRVVDGLFSRFWGYVILTDYEYARRDLHHSAAHFQSDGDICNESAAIFQISASRSLVVAGASRYAVMNGSNPCQTVEYACDAAHNNRTMFHAANSAIWTAQCRASKKSQRRRNEKDSSTCCPHGNCAFIQWHGMAITSCESTLNAFVSAGIGNNDIYRDFNIPAVKIANEFNRLDNGSITDIGVRTPGQSDCNLAATTNIFGRLINNVDALAVCNTMAIVTDITGAFVHIEQKPAVRHLWQQWSQTLINTFVR